jgi:hypothetical protein
MPDAQPARRDHQAEQGHAGGQRGQVDMTAVDERDDHDARHVVSDREREHVYSDAASLLASALARSAGLLAVLAGLVPQGKSTPAAMAADISPGGLR